MFAALGERAAGPSLHRKFSRTLTLVGISKSSRVLLSSSGIQENTSGEREIFFKTLSQIEKQSWVNRSITTVVSEYNSNDLYNNHINNLVIIY
jgi:hypothetical protein